MARGYRRRFRDRIEDRDPAVMWMECGSAYVTEHEGSYATVSDRLIVIRGPDILLQTDVVRLGVCPGTWADDWVDGWAWARLRGGDASGSREP
jgi:hypothetical protein